MTHKLMRGALALLALLALGVLVSSAAVLADSVDLSPEGGPFEIGTTSDHKAFEVVDMNAAGVAIVAWAEPDFNAYPPDEWASSLYALILEPNGAPAGPPILLTNSSSVSVDTYGPFFDVAIGANGEFVAVWEDLQRKVGRGQCFDSNGTATGPAVDLVAGSARIEQPVVEMAAGGSFVVAWREKSGNDYQIKARRFSSDCVPLAGSFLVNNADTGEEYSPDIAMNESGEFLVAWVGWDRDGTGVFGRRFARDGAPIAQQFRVNIPQRNSQGQPAAGMDAAGNAVIAYTSMDMSASPYEFDVWVRLFSSDGVALGEPFRPHESAAEEQSTPQIAVAASGHFVIMWTHHAGCCDYDLWLREFDASGVATGSEQLAAQYGGAGGALATNSGERFLAVWSDYQGEGMHLFGRYFRSDTADTETVLTPTNDAFINLRRARGNFGAKSVLKVKDAAADFHTYIKFNAARVTAPVQSATLRLYVTNGGPDGGDIYAVSSYYDGTQELWLEEHLTPRNAPPITGKSIASLGRVRPGWVEVDVTAAVNQGLTKDAGRVSFGIRNASRNLVAFSSKEGAHAPELVITTEP